MHISEVPTFLAESPSVTTHAIELIDPFSITHPLIISLQLSGVTSYFDVHSPIIAEYKNEDILKIHLTAEEPPWDPSTKEHSEREIIKVRSISLPQWQGDQYVSAQLSHSHWLMMPLMSQMMIILQLY